MSSYKVIAPYVTTKVKDVSGQEVTLGYYRDGLIHNPTDPKHVEALVELGMVESADSGDEPGEPADPEPPVFERPAGNAGRDAWATYALESGQASEDEIKDLSRDELRELYG
jgi:hypothetical protein